MERIHATVRGRVQGVSFRFFVQQNASKIGVNGWVRNRLEGSVELEAEGEKYKLEQLLAVIKQGPRNSRVDEVEVEWLESHQTSSQFVIIPTV